MIHERLSPLCQITNTGCSTTMSFSLTIKIAPKWVDYFDKYEWQFCFARTAQSGGSGKTMDVSTCPTLFILSRSSNNSLIFYKVIAYCDNVAANIKVDWTNTYSMAASKTGFSGGCEYTFPIPFTWYFSPFCDTDVML